MRYSFSGIQFHHRHEIWMLLAGSLQALLMGAFISLFSIGSHVLFLQSWNPDDLPRAFVLSGIVGIILYSFYSFLNSRVHFRKTTLIWILLLLLTNLGAWIFHDSLIHVRFFGIPLMLPFILCIPFTFISMNLLRRLNAEIYTPEQHRRFNVVLRSALIAGIISSSYALVLALFISWDILMILLVSCISIALAFVLQLFINYLHRRSPVFPKVYRKVAPLRSKFYEMFYTRYTLLLISFAILSAVVGFVIHYHFVAETRFNYPYTIGLAKFFGFFTGTMFLFVFAVERFLVRKILYAYDSPYSLVLIPGLLLTASAASLIVDLLVGQSNAFARFSFGFLMVAMLKIGYETTWEAIEIPSMRVLFNTLDLRFTGSIKQRLEGSFRMTALLIAGLFLAGFIFFQLNKSLYLNIFIMILSAIWLPVGIMLVRSYQNALREYIRRLKASKRAIAQDMLNTDERSHSLINSSNPVKSVNTLSILERLEPLNHEKHLVSLLGTESNVLKKYLLERIDENALLSSLPNLKELQKETRQQNGYLSKLVNRFDIKINAGNSKQAIENIVNSHTLTDRILAAEIIGNSGKQEYADYLLQLSRDFEPEVKLASVKAMARLGNPAHSYVLIGYLTTPVYYPYAFEALVKIGDPSLPFMEEYFLLPETDNKLLMRIVRIYGKIGSQAAIDSLLSKIENQNRVISRQALHALREAKFQATPGNINRILNDIVRLINMMAWNFGAYASLSEHLKFQQLRQALHAEIRDNYETLYDLLALAYNPTSIGNIRILLEEGSDTDISFAIELLDQIVHEEIKQVFFPVVENISIRERFKQLQYFFQSIKDTPENLIQEIITRDFNQISLYVKACAIDSILLLDSKKGGLEIVAGIFHPNQLIRESAAHVLYRTEPEKLESIYSRLTQDAVNEIKVTMGHLNDGIPYLLLDRIRFIKNCYPLRNISEDILLEISRALVVHQMKANEEFLVKREDVHFAFMIVLDGMAQINISSGKVFTFVKNDIIYSDILVEDNTFSLKAQTDLRFYSLEQEVLNSLMFDYIDFRDTILEIVEQA